jgi:hypothetical protein
MKNREYLVPQPYGLTFYFPEMSTLKGNWRFALNTLPVGCLKYLSKKVIAGDYGSRRTWIFHLS